MTPYHESDGVTLYHGDCREILPQLGRFDLLLTDPPYVVDTQGGGIGAKRQYLKDIKTADIDRGFDSAFLDDIPNWFASVESSRYRRFCRTQLSPIGC